MIDDEFTAAETGVTKRKKRRFKQKGLSRIFLFIPIALMEKVRKRLKVDTNARAIRVVLSALVDDPEFLNSDMYPSVANSRSRAEIALEMLKDGQRTGWESFRKACYDLCKYGCYEDSRAYTDAARALMQSFKIPQSAQDLGCWEWIRQLEKYQSLARERFEEHKQLRVLIPGPPATAGSYLIIKRDQEFYAEIMHSSDPLLEDELIEWHYPVPMVSQYRKGGKI